MPPRVLGFVRSKIVAFFYLALISPCLLTLTNHTFAQETPVQPTVAPPTPLIHIVRKTDDLSALSKPKQQSPAAHLNYYGGPVVSNLQVVVVFWGPNVNSTVTSQIGGFFQAITDSSYFDLVSEYSTSITPVGGGTGTNQSIGRGNYGGAYTITPSLCAIAPCTITDSEIKAELLAQASKSSLPPPTLDANGNVNTLYMMYFPHGVTITQGGSASCAAGGFCAYHGTASFTLNSKHLLYGVVPDFGAGSGCDSGCGGGNEFQNITSVSSHEMIETVTDADVGIATGFAPPLAWYDPNSQDQDGGGEIGDICNAQQAQVSAGGSTYTVQKEWSNFEGACVSIGASPILDFTAPATAVSGTSFNFTVTVDNPVGTSTDTSFTGTVHFTSSDSQAVLPADYSFTPADKGVQTFGATLNTTGSQTITATDLVNGAVTGTATLAVGAAVQAPTITSANGATFTTGAMGTFTVTTTGLPIPSVTRTGTLPTGVSFVNNGNGTGTLSGTPAAGTSGTYNLVFRAHNSASPDATQNFRLTVNAAPAITSANSTTFTTGAVGTFTVTTTGLPTPSLSRTGTLPNGVSFVDNGNGTATIGGTPATGTNGTYKIVIAAHNVVYPDAIQNFTLTVSAAPAITSANKTTFTTGLAGKFTVTTTGSPAPSLTRTGSLPTGVSFVDNGNGTGNLAGTPAAGSDGTYNIVFNAHNSTAPDATQNFTLTVNAAPAITSANNTAFTIGTAGTFTVIATGSPVPSLSRTGALPGGVSFVDNGNGTGTLSGTPNAGTKGTYNIVFTAHNVVSPDATQSFTLTVSSGTQAPTITSANNTVFNTGTLGSFTVTSTGSPFLVIARTGTLPTGVSFVDNKNGTGTLSGTPAAGTNGTYSIVFKVHNGVSPAAAQNFTLTVNVPPAITSANNTVFTASIPGTFTVTATGSPTPALTTTSSLPSGVSFVDNGDGTGTLGGKPGASTNGTYNIVFTAHIAGSPDDTQPFTLTVNPAPQPPAITSANSTSFTAGTRGTFTVTATGSPTPSLTRSGVLPGGVTFKDNKNGTATLGGTPTAAGTYNITIRAHNIASPDAIQKFTLTVSVAPVITSASNTVFTASTASTFTVTSTGSPTPSLVSTGSLPSGVSFVDNGDGTGTLGGTPAAGAVGNYNIVFTAHNTGSPDATQNFALTVNPGPQAPVITSANSTVFTAGTPGTFTVTATGLPTPSLTKTGALPGGVTFKDNGNGTATLGGTPTAGGVFSITINAHNTVSPNATQKFTLTVSTTPPQVSLSPSIVDFGDVNLNTTVQRVVTLKNTGGSTLSISNIWLTQSVDGAFTLTTNCGASLLPSKTCTATIAFSGSVQKSWLAGLHVADNAADSPQLVAIAAHTR